jgi:galactitol-specific phosphotransferase system IIB component
MHGVREVMQEAVVVVVVKARTVATTKDVVTASLVIVTKMRVAQEATAEPLGFFFVLAVEVVMSSLEKDIDEGWVSTEIMIGSHDAVVNAHEVLTQ